MRPIAHPEILETLSVKQFQLRTVSALTAADSRHCLRLANPKRSPL